MSREGEVLERPAFAVRASEDGQGVMFYFDDKICRRIAKHGKKGVVAGLPLELADKAARALTEVVLTLRLAQAGVADKKSFMVYPGGQDPPVPPVIE